MDSLKIIAKSSILIFIGIFFSKFLGYLYRLIIARIGPEAYGLFSLGLAIITVLAIISILGLDLGIQRYASFYLGKKDEKKATSTIKSALKISLPFSIIMGLILFLFSNYISVHIFNNPGLGVVLKLFAFTLPAYILAKIFFSTLKSFKKVNYWVFTEYFVENSTKIILTLLLVFVLGKGLIGATLAFVLTLYVITILSFYFVEFKVVNIFKITFEYVNNKFELLNYSWPLMLSNLLGHFILSIDILMIGYLLKNASLVGIYNVAVPTALLVIMIPQAILSLFTPVTSTLLAEEKNKEFDNTYKTIVRWIFLINLPLFLLMVLFSKEIITILFGGDYVGAYKSLIVLLFGYVIFALGLSSKHILNVIKKTKLVLINNITVVILNIILNLILIPIYGIIGAAFATSISLFVFSLLLLIETFSFIKVQPINFNFVKYLISGGVTYFIVYKLRDYFALNILNLILLGVIFLIFYIGLVFLQKGINKEDINVIKSIFKFQ